MQGLTNLLWGILRILASNVEYILALRRSLDERWLLWHLKFLEDNFFMSNWRSASWTQVLLPVICAILAVVFIAMLVEHVTLVAFENGNFVIALKFTSTQGANRALDSAINDSVHQ